MVPTATIPGTDCVIQRRTAWVIVERGYLIKKNSHFSISKDDCFISDSKTSVSKQILGLEASETMTRILWIFASCRWKSYVTRGNYEFFATCEMTKSICVDICFLMYYSKKQSIFRDILSDSYKIFSVST